MKTYLSVLFFIFISIASFSQTKIYRIGFLLDKSNNEVEALLNLLQDEIVSVIGQDAIIDFPQNSRRTNNFEDSVVIQNYRDYINEGYDIVISFGTVNNKALFDLQEYPVPTILFGTLSNDLVGNEAFEKYENRKNFTAIATVHSYEEDLNLLKQLVNPKRVGVLVEQAFYEAVSGLGDEFNALQQKTQMELKAYYFK